MSTDVQDQPSAEVHSDDSLTKRVIMPIALPVGILLAMVVVVGVIAFTLLYSTKVLAIVNATLIAAGVMVAMSLYANSDEGSLDAAKRTVIWASGVLPVIAAVAIAVLAVPDEERQINVEEILLAPEGALIGAQNAQNFCNFQDDGTCVDSQETTFPAQPDSEDFRFLFNNINEGIPHNVQLFELAGTPEEPEAGEGIFLTEDGSTIFNGIDEQVYVVEGFSPEEGQQFYYNCVVHPNMLGVLTIGAPPA